MAALRPVEERDSKGSTLRVNPSVCYKQSPEIRTIRGRNDFSFEANPDYHKPITAQVQDGQIRFFAGIADTAVTRKLAKEIPLKDVPKYIIDELKAHPLRVRESRPMVYEVKVVTVGDQEVTRVDEIYSQDGLNITVTPSAPEVPTEAPERKRRGRAAALKAAVGDEAVEA